MSIYIYIYNMFLPCPQLLQTSCGYSAGLSGALPVLQCGTVCCGVLQYVAVYCGVLRCDAVCCSVCSMLQCVIFGRPVLRASCVAVCCSMLQEVTVCCGVLQYVSVYCGVLRCDAVCCSALPRADRA